MEANCSGAFIIIKKLHFSEMFLKLEILHFMWMLSGVANMLMSRRVATCRWRGDKETSRD
jgi:hypothetical protein